MQKPLKKGEFWLPISQAETGDAMAQSVARCVVTRKIVGSIPHRESFFSGSITQFTELRMGTRLNPGVKAAERSANHIRMPWLRNKESLHSLPCTPNWCVPGFILGRRFDLISQIRSSVLTILICQWRQ